MGRRKIQIQPITNERNRSVTFLKRKNGLFKKAYELATLCSVEVALVVFEHRPGREVKLHQYSSKDIQSIFNRCSSWKGIRDIKYPDGAKGAQDDSDDEGDGSEDDMPLAAAHDKKRRRTLPSLDDETLFKMEEHDSDSPPPSRGSSRQKDRAKDRNHLDMIPPYPSPTLSNAGEKRPGQQEAENRESRKRLRLDLPSFMPGSSDLRASSFTQGSSSGQALGIEPHVPIPPSMIPYLQAAAAAHAQDTQMQSQLYRTASSRPAAVPSYSANSYSNLGMPSIGSLGRYSSPYSTGTSGVGMGPGGNGGTTAHPEFEFPFNEMPSSNPSQDSLPPFFDPFSRNDGTSGGTDPFSSSNPPFDWPTASTSDSRITSPPMSNSGRGQHTSDWLDYLAPRSTPAISSTSKRRLEETLQ